MKYSEVVDYILDLIKSGGEFALEPIKQALKELGNPEKCLKIIHIAGTNGKGSVGAMITAILQDAGFRVGFFTSPHLIDFRERIRINDDFISEEDVVNLFKKIKEKNIDLTYFEFLTLMALLYFKEKAVDYAVLETGLGGKLDATNVCQSIVSVITPISLDHTHILGETIEEITRDKSNIIKPNAITITGFQKPETLEIIKNKASEKNCKFIEVNEALETNLLGEFQKRNAGIAAAACRELEIKEDKIRNGLQKVNWPGRLQYLEPNLLVDGAHNIEGLDSMKQYVNSLNRDVIIVFGASGKRNPKEMIARLPKHKTLIFTQSESANIDMGHTKGIDPETINIDCIKIKDFRKALNYARSLQEHRELILVTGSIYLVGDVMKYLGVPVEKGLKT